MGNVGLGLAPGAEYVEPRGAEPGRAPKPLCAAFVLPHSGHRVKVQKAGHRESTVGMGMSLSCARTPPESRPSEGLKIQCWTGVKASFLSSRASHGSSASHIPLETSP